MFSKDKYEKIRKPAFIATVVFLALVAGCRGIEVGHDTFNYYAIFKRVAGLSFDRLFIAKPYNDLEKGFLLFCWLFTRISNNFSYFLLLVAFIEFGLIGIFIWKNSKNQVQNIVQ